MGPRSIASHRVQGTIFVESAVPQQVSEESGGERWGPVLHANARPGQGTSLTTNTHDTSIPPSMFNNCGWIEGSADRRLHLFWERCCAVSKDVSKFHTDLSSIVANRLSR